MLQSKIKGEGKGNAGEKGGLSGKESIWAKT